MDNHLHQILRYGLMLLMSCNTTVHAYRILVSNGLASDIYAAVYRYNDEQTFRIRTSAVKLIKAGQTAWFGGVLPDSEHVSFQLYGSTSRKPLAEALSATAPSADPYSLLDVGTGNQVFVIMPPAAAPVAEQLAPAHDEQPQLDVQPGEQIAIPSEEPATTESVTPSTNDSATAQDAVAPAEQLEEDAISPERTDAMVDQPESQEKQQEDAAVIIVSDMLATDSMMLMHDEQDMQRSLLLRTVHLSLAAQHASLRAQTTTANEEPVRMSPHQQRPQKHLHRTRHA